MADANVLRSAKKASVAIAGAGLSGLCLAQKLVAAGFDVRVYERDPTPETRRQGYRITLDEHGIAALKSALPDRLFQTAMATASTPAETGYFVITNSQLGVVFRLTFKSDPSKLDLTTPRQFDRATLRAILLSGLEDRVLFNKRTIGAEAGGDDVVLKFEDGDTATCDVAIGADGVHSALQSELLPGCTPADSGARAIYGRSPLTVDGAPIIPKGLKDSGLLALGRPGHAFFFTTMEFGEPPECAFAMAGLSQPAPVRDDYLMWALVFPADPDAPELEEMTSEALHALSVECAREFHQVLQRFVEVADRDATIAVKIRAAPQPAHWSPSRIALMGDAVHIMPPFESGGGNTALRDASLLGEVLAAGREKGEAVENAIADYHEQMSRYAFPLVESSVKQLGRVNMRNGFVRWAMLELIPSIRSFGSRPLLARS